MWRWNMPTLVGQGTLLSVGTDSHSTYCTHGADESSLLQWGPHMSNDLLAATLLTCHNWSEAWGGYVFKCASDSATIMVFTVICAAVHSQLEWKRLLDGLTNCPNRFLIACSANNCATISSEKKPLVLFSLYLKTCCLAFVLSVFLYLYFSKFVRNLLLLNYLLQLFYLSVLSSHCLFFG